MAEHLELIVSNNAQFDRFARHRAIKRRNYLHFLEQELKKQIKGLNKQSSFEFSSQDFYSINRVNDQI